jgi:hypothetical protein
MQLKLDIKHIGDHQHVGGGRIEFAGGRPGLKFAGGKRVRYPDGDLLLQPESLRCRVA